MASDRVDWLNLRIRALWALEGLLERLLKAIEARRTADIAKWAFRGGTP